MQMTDPTLAGTPPAPLLDPRLRELLRDLPEAQAAVVDALIRDRDRLVALADRRADRLQRLQEVSATLSRSLDQEDIERELARQVARMIQCGGVVVARPTEGGSHQVSLHWRDGNATSDDTTTPAAHAIDAVSRTGRVSRATAKTESGARNTLDAATPSVLAVPLMVGYKLTGIVAVYGDEAGAFGSEEEELLHTIGATAATALVNATLFAESLLDKRQSEALAAMAGALGSSLRLSDVLNLAIRHSMTLLGGEGASVGLRRGEFLHLVATAGIADPVQGFYVPVADSVMGRAMLEGRSIVVNDAITEPSAYQRTRGIAGIDKGVSAPMLTPNGPIGVLSVVNRARDFTNDDARVLERLAAQLALAVVNARLYEEASEATREVNAAFDAIAGGMAVIDGEGFITRHNARLEPLAGLGEGHPLVGRALFDALLHEPREISDDDPLGAALRLRVVGRGTIRQEWSGRVFNLVASPHPAGGAVVTIDDVTSFYALAERYRLVVESTTDAILITSDVGKIEFANDAAIALFAQPVSLIGVPLASLVPAELEEELGGHISRALIGEAMRFNGSVIRAGGECRTVSMSLAPIRGGARVSGLVVSLRDMTDETRARSEVAAANSRYRNLVEVAADAIYTLAPTGVFTSANVACEVLTGISREAMIGRSILPMLEPSETAEAVGHFRAALGGATRRYEAHLVRPDGTRRLLSMSNTPIHLGNDVIGVLGVARDVTDDRARAAALERADALYTRLVESADDAICTIDEEGNFTSVNRALERTMGVTREEVIGQHFTTLLPADERDDKWVMFAAAITGERQRREFRFFDAQGRKRVASVNSSPILDHGRIAGALAIIRDVTEERSLLEQVVRREKLVALGEMVGGVAHEVNSPLTGILAFAQILQTEPLGNDENQRAVDTIVTEAKRAARIVGKLLTFARQNPAEKMPTELNQVLLDTIELRRYPLKMQQITLDLDLAESLPVTWADPFQLQQVFINLLSNAEQSLVSVPGDRRITVRTTQRDGYLVTVISDTGPGIAPEHLAHIFNPFYTTKPRGIGTGLGLSISFGIIREHGGILRVLSEPSHGAAFEVSLPIVASPSSGNQ